MVRVIVSVVGVLVGVLLGVVASAQLAALENSGPLGTEYQVDLTVTGSGLGKADVVRGLDGLVDRTGVRIAKIVPDPADYAHGRSVYEFGTTHRRAPSVFRWYEPSWHGELRSSADLGDASLDGAYAVSGPVAGVDALRAWATEHHVPVTVSAVLQGWKLFVFTVLWSGAYAAVSAVVLLLGVAVVTWQASRARARSLLALAGVSRLRVQVDEWIRLSGLLGLPLVGVAAIACGVVAVRSGPEFIGPFLAVVVPLLVVGYLCGMGLSVLVGSWSWPSVRVLASRVSPLIGLRGWSEVVKVGTLLGTMVFVPIAVTTIGTSVSVQRTAEYWALLKDRFSVNGFGTVPGSPEDVAVGKQFQALVSEAASGGTVALGYPLEATLSPGEPQAGYDAVILANPTYLQVMGVSVDTAPAGRNGTVVPIRAADLPSTVRDVTAPMLGIQIVDRSVDAGTWAPFRVFRYQGGGFPVVWQEGAPTMRSVRNPVVLVLDDPGRFTANTLLAFTSRDALTFGDRATLQRLLTQHGLVERVRSVDRAADPGLIRLQYETRTLVFQVVAAVTLGIAVLFGVWLAARTYAVSRIRRLVPMRLSGLSWYRILRFRLVGEGILTVVAAFVVIGVLASLRADVAVWWTLLVPLGTGILTAALTFREASSVFHAAIARHT